MHRSSNNNENEENWRRRYLSDVRIPSFYENIKESPIPMFTTPHTQSSESSGSGEKLSITSSNGGETRLLRAVHSAYRRWAYFIVDHAWKVIGFCLLLTTICTLKVATTPQRNSITGYTPYGARSLNELAINDEFSGASDSGVSFGAYVLLMPINGTNLMDLDSLREAIEVDDIIRSNITLFNHVTNRYEAFDQFCDDFCDINEGLRNFYKGYSLQTIRLRNNQSLHPRISLRYPLTRIFGRKFSIQPNFFGVTYSNVTTGTGSREDVLTNIESVAMILLVYKAERVGKWSDEEVKDYEMRVHHYFQNDYKSDRLRVMSISTTYVEVEVVRAGLSMLPFLVFGFLIMAVCSSTTVMLSAIYMQQANFHKITLAIMACVCPFMACGTAMGILFFCGVRFGSILCVTPFLVLAIGVDDAYLMIHAWQRISKQLANRPVKEDCVAYRLSLVLIDTGPAVLISALTNITADAVGSVTGSPEVTLLCIGNMASIFVDFIYQVTFYSSVMALIGFYEMRQEARKSYTLSIPIGNTPASCGDAESCEGVGCCTAIADKFSQNMSISSSFHDSVSEAFQRFTDKYIDFITNKLVATIIFLLWVAFIVFALIGISRFEVNLTSKKLFAEDSPLLMIEHYREEHIIPYYTMATIFVNNPGDMTNPKRLAKLDEMVSRFENLPEAWGPDSTNYFMRDFLAYQEDGQEEKMLDEEDQDVKLSNSTDLQLKDQFDAEDLATFLTWPEYKYWKGFLRLGKENGKTVLKKFFLTTAYHGDRLRSWAERTYLFQKWRRIADSYPEFNVSIYHDEGIFLDLIDNMPTDTWQSVLATLVCMGFICFIFMYDTFTVIVSSAIIASIMTGMLGLLSWCGVTMDPIMMAALIISIGFSVDIPAHVSYHYHSSGFESSEQRSVKERLKITFNSVGFPALQASLSTSLCVLSLLFVKLYMAKIFVQIMCSCLLMCVVHSLLLLPALFSVFEHAENCYTKQRLKRGSVKVFGANPQRKYVPEKTVPNGIESTKSSSA